MRQHEPYYYTSEYGWECASCGTYNEVALPPSTGVVIDLECEDCGEITYLNPPEDYDV